jgi:ribonuclease P protein component
LAISFDPSLREGEGIRLRYFFSRPHRLDSVGSKRLLDHGKRFTVEQSPVKLSARVLLASRSEDAPSQDAKVSAASPSSRLAIAAPKRLLKRAVDRNRVKRIVREAFRLSSSLQSQPQDIMVTLVSTPKRVTRETKRVLRDAANALIAQAARNTRVAPATDTPVAKSTKPQGDA